MKPIATVRLSRRNVLVSQNPMWQVAALSFLAAIRKINLTAYWQVRSLTCGADHLT